MRQIVAWDGPAPFPGDYLAGRGADDCWRITGIARLPTGGRLSLDMQKASRAAMPACAVMHAWSRLASHDAEGPARVRQVSTPGPTSVMRSEWRDPDDIKPNASHRPRQITGYRTFCPLRRMMTRQGSEIDERMVFAADILRSQVDIAVIGKGARSMEGVRQGFGPVTGPPGSALAQIQALTQARRALARLAPATRALVAEVVLFNRTIHAWCHLIDPTRDARVETGRLLAALEVLVDHYAAEIDEALARGRMLEVA